MPSHDRNPSSPGVDGVTRPVTAEGATPTPELGDVEGTLATETVEATTDIASQATDAVTQALASGALETAEAERMLIDAAVRASLPPDSDPALVAALRAEVAAILTADPTLAALLLPR